MAEIIRMPLMSDTMTEGVVVQWHKNIGDQVKAGDLLAEIETDKATMELESYQEGHLLHIGAQPGETVAVNSIIAVLGDKGEDIQKVLDQEAKEVKEKSAETEEEKVEEKSNEIEEEKAEEKSTETKEEKSEEKSTKVTESSSASSSDRIKASPLAKKMATENNIDLSVVTGTGDEGRIIKRDVLTFLDSGSAAASSSSANSSSTNSSSASGGGNDAQQDFVLPQVVGEESFKDVKNSQMRKTIARRLSESKFGAPHFYLKMTICMDNAIAARKKMNEFSPVKISFNDMVIKAAAMALRLHSDVNASWMGDVIRYNNHINIGMAVAVDEGLMVPVVKFADGKSLSHIAAETKTLAGKARERKLDMAEMTGNTFTISNLGMMDIDDFTAIINPPDACIMAVGKIEKTPSFNEAGEVVAKNLMRVTLSCDHRVVDGAVGARFLNTFKGFLEEPIRMMV